LHECKISHLVMVARLRSPSSGWQSQEKITK
jgi:hypothetical protein